MRKIIKGILIVGFIILALRFVDDKPPVRTLEEETKRCKQKVLDNQSKNEYDERIRYLNENN